MAYENLLLEKDEKIGIITINRPEVRNALNNQTVQEIFSAFEELERDENIQIIVFTGIGEKAFAAGADINQLTARQAIEAFNPNSMTEVYRRIEKSKKATIAAINGYALGGGCELAMSCDIRMASDHAKFGLPELNLSVIPGAGGTQRLTRIIGKGRAMNMILTGEFLSANEAKGIGLVSDVVPMTELMDAVRMKAERILTKGPLAVQMAKLVINHGFEADLDTGLLLETFAQAFLYGTNDKIEGTQAFLEKRPAVFSGS